MIRYSVVQGEIPQGCRLISDRGVMKIVGVIPLDPSVNPPTFNSGRELGIITEKQPVSITIAVQPNGGKSLVNSEVIDGFLPWGLVLQGNTISGTPTELQTKDVVDFLPGDAPVWTTRDGLLADIEEFSTFELDLEAAPKSGALTFNIVKGGLPWGLKLFSNGSIIGTLEEDRSGEPVVTPPAPIWDTPKGQLAILDEFQDVLGDLSVSAFSRSDKPIRFFVVSGALPWGLKLRPLTGAITGKLAELQLGGADENPATQIKPSLPSAPITGQVGSPFSLALTPTLPPARELLSMEVTSGHLPLGIKLQGNTLTGIPTISGTGSFDITVIDNAFAKSTTTFNFEVSA